MHGMMFCELKRYVDATAGPGAWATVRADAGVDRPHHVATEAYPNAELVVLVEAASRLTGITVSLLLEDFGAFVAPGLVTVCAPSIHPEWGALDLLERTERHLHRHARLRDPLASPPRLRVHRVSPSEVQITYASPRRLCHVARGIARGVLTHFRQSGSISETSCMHRGDATCIIVVRTMAA